jgi:hypothetical protein
MVRPCWWSTPARPVRPRPWPTIPHAPCTLAAARAAGARAGADAGATAILPPQPVAVVHHGRGRCARPGTALCSSCCPNLRHCRVTMPAFWRWVTVNMSSSVPLACGCRPGCRARVPRPRWCAWTAARRKPRPALAWQDGVGALLHVTGQAAAGWQSADSSQHWCCAAARI